MIKVLRHLCGAFIINPFLLDFIFLDLNSQEIFCLCKSNYVGLDILHLRLFCRGDFGIAVPCEQRLFLLIGVDLLGVANVQVMVARLHELFQGADDGKRAVEWHTDFAFGKRLHLDAELFDFVGVPARRASAAQHGFRDFFTGHGEDEFFVLPHHFAAERRFRHRVGNHIRVVGKVRPP